MGDKKAKDLPHEGQNMKGKGADMATPSNKGRGEGLGGRDDQIGQTRTGRNAQRNGV